ncbi:hypothetical protein J1605_019245 [Eschrichtius robustus]|uniref:Protein lin-52 homolog n=1 Tax=Eschrichtius robustus TaxID=9764 RepID=A0AB34HQT3_ESCRO|nr:hypothetical protein J1605_019245 [Eschrichtius robustus]
MGVKEEYLQRSSSECFVLGADLEASLLSFEKLDRASPDLWPEQCKFLVSLYQNQCRSDFPGGAVVKSLPADAGDTVQSLVREDPTCRRAAKPYQVLLNLQLPSKVSPPKWMAEIERDDIDMLKAVERNGNEINNSVSELGSLTTANLMEKVRGLQNLAYQLGLDEFRNTVLCRKYDLGGTLGTSLVAQWLRIRLPVQGTRVRALVREDRTCRRAAKPVRHNYRACALEPVSHNY